ncbi:MAG: MarR family transcriptional regulator [Desulfobacteraceae bacterium]|nr:MarR family transcriptional regulator [Desulfobacteraceae bacterium]
MYEKLAQESMGKRINVLFRLCMMNFRNEMKKLGFGAGDYAFLALLFLNEGVSQDELSKLMRVDKSYTARALAKFEKSRIVERRSDPDEHRIKRVYIGPKAREIKTEFFNLLSNWNDVLVKDIDADDLLKIRSGMDKMIKNAEASLGLEETI